MPFAFLTDGLWMNAVDCNLNANQARDQLMPPMISLEMLMPTVTCIVVKFIEF